MLTERFGAILTHTAMGMGVIGGGWCLGTAGVGTAGILIERGGESFVDLKNATQIERDVSVYDVDTRLFRDRVKGRYNLLNANTDGVKISVSDGLEDRYHRAVDLVVDYLNDVFEVINPDYTFRVVRDGARDADIVVDSDNKDGADIEYDAVCMTRGYNLRVLNQNLGSRILFNEDNTKYFNTQDLGRMFLHEMGHTLGFCDRYEDKYADTSVMYGYTQTGGEVKFYEKDFRALTALYKKPNVSLESIMGCIKNPEMVTGVKKSNNRDDFGR